MTGKDAGYDPIETASRDEITALQVERLKCSLAQAYDNVPRYREKFDAAGVHPSDFREPADLTRFPMTTKEDLRQSYPFGLFAVPMNRIVRIHASSGTTGKPTVVGYTQGDIDIWTHLMARSIYAAGGRSGDKAHIAYGYGLFTGGLGAHYGAERLACTVIPVSGGQTARQLQLIIDFKPDIIMCTPSYMLHLAEAFRAEGLDPAATSLRIGVFGAEPWSKAVREVIEQTCALDAIDIYGLSEVVGPGVACECIEAKDGPVIWEDHFYPEIVDPETGAPLADGEFGELLFTTLTKEALPVIRYRTRDLTRLLPPTARAMRRFERITGRSDDMLIVRGVNVFPSQFEELLLADTSLSPHYQLEQSKEGALDVLTLKVEPRGAAAAAATRAIADRLAETIKDRLGVSVKISVEAPGTIARSEGKAVRVVDLRPPS